MLDQIAAWSRGTDVRLLDAPPGGGYSNELVFVEIGGEAQVLRLVPAGPPLFPSYDLDMQVAVQEAAAAAGAPVPSPFVAEQDPSWLGRPFLAMPRIDGRHPGEAPMLTPWIQALTPEDQRRLQDGFLDALAAVHRADPTGLGLRPWSEELGFWERFAAWACEGRVAPDALFELVAACRASAPSSFAGSTVLWGDVRMGNTVVSDDLSVAAVLDWEMASEGPAESDLAWLTALHALTLSFVGDDLPGFRGRDEVIAHHESALGRPMRDMAWHEAFAITRAACLQYRVDIVKSIVKGRPTPDPAAHVMVGAARAALDAL
jgi:aminoglycoside phosphotransferase (APT) family kinase protein